MNEKIILLSLLFFIASVGVFRFIQLSNDNIECSQKIENKRYANGKTVTIKNHVCVKNIVSDLLSTLDLRLRVL